MLGIIGGTGLYKIDGFTEVTSQNVQTPFGSPSASVMHGKLSGQRVAFLPRHGNHHEILPSEINFRANIWALKSLGVRKIISVSAVGSLQKEIQPGHLAVPSQYFDWTRGKRSGSFFGEGLVAHVSTAEPVCPSLTALIHTQAKSADLPIHRDKTYACVEGPRLGTKAESLFFRQNGCDLVGMTNIPEAFLAREAQLCYSTIGVVTDYDCWLEDPRQHASVDKVMELYKKNIGRVQDLLKQVIAHQPATSACQCRSALKFAVLTDEKLLGPEQKKVLAFLRE